MTSKQNEVLNFKQSLLDQDKKIAAVE